MRKILLMLLTLVAILVPLSASAASETESRLPAEDFALQQKILFPEDDGSFNKKGKVTRLEFTLATVNRLYSDEDFDNCFRNLAPSPRSRFRLLFTDVDRDSWYGKHLCVAMRAGLIKGDHTGAFRPFAPISTAEASSILARAYGLLYPPLHVTDQPWYEGPMLALSIHGAIGNDVLPRHPVSREEMATMFYALRYQQRFPESRIIGSQNAPTPSLRGVCGAPFSGSCATTPGNPSGFSLRSGIPVQKLSHRLLRKQINTRTSHSMMVGP